MSKDRSVMFNIFDVATTDQQRATSSYVHEAFRDDPEARDEILEALGLKPYDHMATINRSGRTRRVRVQ